MKIQHPDGIGRSGGPGHSGRPTLAPAPRPAAPEARAEDRVEISARAAQIAALAEQARSLPEVRQERVEEFRRLLAEGRHRTDPREVARAILEFEDDLAR
jgi:flagellar biosynthesis anti-sigma factor FlgM